MHGRRSSPPGTSAIRRAPVREFRSRGGLICGRSRPGSAHFLVASTACRSPRASCATERRSRSIESRHFPFCVQPDRGAKQFFARAVVDRTENFLAEGIFLWKTCCTNMTNLYNYEQVEPEIVRVPLRNTSLRSV